jgi:hypothetical protein
MKRRKSKKMMWRRMPAWKKAELVNTAPRGMFVCNYHGKRKNVRWDKQSEAERHAAAIKRAQGF